MATSPQTRCNKPTLKVFGRPATSRAGPVPSSQQMPEAWPRSSWSTDGTVSRKKTEETSPTARTDTYTLVYAGRTVRKEQTCYTRAMRERRTYTDEDKTQALALLLDGVSQVAVETRLDIPQQTLSHWRSEWIELNQERSDELQDAELRLARRFDAIVERKLDAIDAGEEKISMQQAVIGAGIYRTKAKERQETAAKHPPPINFEKAVFIIKKGD